MSPALADGLLITGPLGKSKSGKPSGSLVMVVLMKILVQISALPLTGYVIMGNLFIALLRMSLLQSVNMRIIFIHIFCEYLFRNHHVLNTVSVNQTQL